jgi:hypothetical protein
MTRRVLSALALLFVATAAPPPASPPSVVSVAHAQESIKVWVNTRSGVYHCPGSRYYGNTKAGEFMPEAEARADGNRAAYGQSCGASVGRSDPVAS